MLLLVFNTFGGATPLAEGYSESSLSPVSGITTAVYSCNFGLSKTDPLEIWPLQSSEAPCLYSVLRVG